MNQPSPFSLIFCLEFQDQQPWIFFFAKGKRRDCGKPAEMHCTETMVYVGIRLWSGRPWKQRASMLQDVLLMIGKEMNARSGS